MISARRNGGPWVKGDDEWLSLMNSVYRTVTVSEDPRQNELRLEPLSKRGALV